MLENYCKTVVIEANTMVDIARTEILPAIQAYAVDTANAAAAKKELNEMIPCGYEISLVKKLSVLISRIDAALYELEDALIALGNAKDIAEESILIRDTVIAKMSELRLACDEAETVTAKKYWPLPSYGELLFGVS